jgi:hypothetical protein
LNKRLAQSPPKLTGHGAGVASREKSGSTLAAIAPRLADSAMHANLQAVVQVTAHAAITRWPATDGSGIKRHCIT